METGASGEDVAAYESRTDLAIHSALSEPAAEPRCDPPSAQGPRSSHAKKSELKVAESQPEATAHKHKYKHSRDNFMSPPKTEVKQSERSPGTQSLQENASPSKDAANRTMTTSLPDYISRRNELFEKLKRQRHTEILDKEKPEINVVLDLGRDTQGKPRTTIPVAAKAWESTPASFLRYVNKDVSSDVVIAKIDGKELWDLDRPLEYECCVSYISFSSEEGRNVFWHSSAHVLGEACECHFNCLLSHGPPVEQGFFYDMAIADG